jgi:hypothetical protein
MTLREEYQDTIGKLEKYCKEEGLFVRHLSH